MAKVRKLFGVAKKWGILPGRVTFVIDREGVVRHVYLGLRESEQHVTEALGERCELSSPEAREFRAGARRSVTGVFQPDPLKGNRSCYIWKSPPDAICAA